jgi:5-methylcytosine-specific restriction endonuclease McrA
MTYSQSQKNNYRINGTRKGSLSGNWQGGKSLEKYGSNWKESLKENIRIRDKFTCQLCNIRQNELNGFHKKLDVHHIDYNKLNLSQNNLISLCRKCHTKTGFNREKWKKFFEIIIKERYGL